MYALTQSFGAFREVSVFLISLVVGLAAILLIRRAWRWDRGRDFGDGVRKLQREPVLRVGGLALYLVFVLSFLVAFTPTSDDSDVLGMSFLLLGSTMFLLGFLDDLFGLPALVKLLVQIGVGTAAYLHGMRIDIVSHPLGLDPIDTGGFGLILTVAWFVAIPNLINLVDGMDGLAGGIALFLCLTLATLGAIAGNHELLLLNVALAGGIVAFLAFNLPPAKIYLGDGGAYLLGFAIAGSSLLSSNKGSVFGSLLVVVIVLGFPILDTALAMVRRGLSGLPLMRADALHLHHRLQVLGFSKRNILFALYGIFAGLSLLGLSVFLSAGYTLPIVGMIATLGAIQGLRFLGLPHNLSEARRTLRDLFAARKDVRYAYALSLVLEHELEREDSSENFWSRLGDCVGRLGLEPLGIAAEEVKGGGARPLARATEERGLVVLKLDASTLWLLACEAGESGRKRWVRAARCFYPVIIGAKRRWGGALPASLGFVEFESEEALARVEESLKQEMGFAPSPASAAVAALPLALL